jgi:hypothetical protein
MKHIQNAKITHTDLTIADHGLLSGWITLDYGGSGQGFGGHSLYLPRSFKHHVGQCNFAGHWIFRVMEIAGVEHWKDLEGKTIRVEHDKDGIGGMIIAIGHIIENKWFDPKAEFEELNSQKAVLN